MKSHAIPKCLLKRFAYLEPRTESHRLWRYEIGRKSVGTASPKSETRTEGYFARPSDPRFEESIEKTLADKIENEVHDELVALSSPLFVLSDRHKRALTRYIALLFTRCPGRKLAVRTIMQETRRRLVAFVDNDAAVLQYAVKVSMKERQYISADRFRRTWRKLLSEEEDAESMQEQFAATLDRWKEHFDDHLYHGQWNFIYSADGGFIIGDNPVVTWKMENGQPSFGVGIHVPGAEVFLPISPTACLHLLPAGHPRPFVSRPTPVQVNEAQIMFMTKRVYSQRLMPEINDLVQRKGAVLQMGHNCFLIPRNDEADAARLLDDV